MALCKDCETQIDLLANVEPHRNLDLFLDDQLNPNVTVRTYQCNACGSFLTHTRDKVARTNSWVYDPLM